MPNIRIRVSRPIPRVEFLIELLGSISAACHDRAYSNEIVYLICNTPGRCARWHGSLWAGNRSRSMLLFCVTNAPTVFVHRAIEEAKTGRISDYDSQAREK